MVVRPGTDGGPCLMVVRLSVSHGGPPGYGWWSVMVVRLSVPHGGPSAYGWWSVPHGGPSVRAYGGPSGYGWHRGSAHDAGDERWRRR